MMSNESSSKDYSSSIHNGWDFLWKENTSKTNSVIETNDIHIGARRMRYFRAGVRQVVMCWSQQMGGERGESKESTHVVVGSGQRPVMRACCLTVPLHGNVGEPPF